MPLVPSATTVKTPSVLRPWAATGGKSMGQYGAYREQDYIGDGNPRECAAAVDAGCQPLDIIPSTVLASHAVGARTNDCPSHRHHCSCDGSPPISQACEGVAGRIVSRRVVDIYSTSYGLCWQLPFRIEDNVDG